MEQPNGSIAIPSVLQEIDTDMEATLVEGSISNPRGWNWLWSEKHMTMLLSDFELFNMFVAEEGHDHD